MAEADNLSVGGFLFFTRKDAQLAEVEVKKMEYLEARIDYSRPDSVLAVYVKTIQERVFRTPVGLQYLSGLREFLLERPEVDPDEVPEIPLYITFAGDLRNQEHPVRDRLAFSERKEQGREKTRFFISVIVNVLLALAVISMFTIALKSDHPNILNYERAVTNKYAAWEQELTEREQRIREKERELRIEVEP